VNSGNFQSSYSLWEIFKTKLHRRDQVNDTVRVDVAISVPAEFLPLDKDRETELKHIHISFINFPLRDYVKDCEA
jgi:hypothetical protein